jgi:hypothetical protein
MVAAAGAAVRTGELREDRGNDLPRLLRELVNALELRGEQGLAG